MSRARFYKRLWEDAERARREADAALAEQVASTRLMAAHVLSLLDLLGMDDSSNAEMRGEVRKLRRAVEASKRRAEA